MLGTLALNGGDDILPVVVHGAQGCQGVQVVEGHVVLRHLVTLAAEGLHRSPVALVVLVCPHCAQFLLNDQFGQEGVSRHVVGDVGELRKSSFS